jgi:hypothetical protein
MKVTSQMRSPTCVTPTFWPAQTWLRFTSVAYSDRRVDQDDDSDDQPFYTPGNTRWQLRNGDRRLTSELRDDEKAGAGVDVQILEAEGWPPLTWRCATREPAEFLADSYDGSFCARRWTDAG